MREEDDWVKLAQNDDAYVVELLFKLKQAPSPPLLLGFDWSMRQRRSKHKVSRKKECKVAVSHASPTTPLSWSAGTASVSGGDGFEDSSLPARTTTDTARSTVAVTRETSKRSRKKKTLPELKEAECLLLKEKCNLNDQLTTLQVTLENLRAANANLKRMKLELQSRPTPPMAAVAVNDFNMNQSKQIKLPCDPTCSIMQTTAVFNKHEPSSWNAAFQKHDVGGMESSFTLPDLNLPIEDNSGPDILYGIS